MGERKDVRRSLRCARGNACRLLFDLYSPHCHFFAAARISRREGGAWTRRRRGGKRRGGQNISANNSNGHNHGGSYGNSGGGMAGGGLCVMAMRNMSKAINNINESNGINERRYGGGIETGQRHQCQGNIENQYQYIGCGCAGWALALGASHRRHRITAAHRGDFAAKTCKAVT